jgi:hypothetical protein
MPERRTLLGAGIALGLIVLGALGVLSNPKPSPVPAGTADATRAAADRVGAQVQPTAKQPP